MLLFSRVVTPTASPKRFMPFVHEVTAFVNEHSSLDVHCWMAGFGMPVGTVAWTTIVDSQATLAAATADLMTNAAYLDLLDGATEMATSPAVDSLSSHIYGDRKPSAPGSVLNMTSGVAETARMADAVAWAVDMASYVETLIESPVVVASSLFGTLGQMSFVSIYDDYAEADAVRAKVQTDAGYHERITGSAGLFVSGSGTVVQATRII